MNKERGSPEETAGREVEEREQEEGGMRETGSGETVREEIEEEVVYRDGGQLDGLKGSLLSQQETDGGRRTAEWNTS